MAFGARMSQSGLLNEDRLGWPRKLELAGTAVFCNPGDARWGFEVIAECGSLGRG